MLSSLSFNAAKMRYRASIFLVCAAATPTALAASSGTAQQRASFEQFKASAREKRLTLREYAHDASALDADRQKKLSNNSRN